MIMRALKIENDFLTIVGGPGAGALVICPLRGGVCTTHCAAFDFDEVDDDLPFSDVVLVNYAYCGAIYSHSRWRIGKLDKDEGDDIPANPPADTTALEDEDDNG
jgi:hypothetical protein